MSRMTRDQNPAIGLNVAEQLARARADMRAGVPVALLENGTGLIFVPTESLSRRRLDAFRGLGEPVAVLTARRASTLKARIYDTDIARLAIPPGADENWVQALADPATDLDKPMKGPFHEIRGGDASLHRLAIALAKTARLLPAVMAVSGADVARHAAANQLTTFDAGVLAENIDTAAHLERVVSARVPLELAGSTRLHVFRPEDGAEEHYAIEIGHPDRNRPVLARLHSACFTGDLLGSLKCDCGPQLHSAISAINAEGSGVLLYLNQEGRGIGLANKMRAYALQDQGFDTVEANHRLGFEDDERDFRIGAELLKSLGFGSVRLMTNNPRKMEKLQQNGIDVTERVPLIVGKTRENEAYLRTKSEKSGHLF